MSTTQNKRTITKKLPVLKTLEKGKKQELMKVFKAIAKAAKLHVKDAKKEAAKQAKIDAKEAAKQAKIDAKEAIKQAKIDAKEAAKQAKIDAKEEAKQAAKAKKEAIKQAKVEVKEAMKRLAAQTKIVNVAAKELRYADEMVAKQESKLLRVISRCKKVEVCEETRTFVMNWVEYVSGCIVSDTVLDAARVKQEETKDVV